MNESNQKLLNHENMNELNQEPLDHEKQHEPNPNPLDYDKNNEPDQEQLDNDKSADQFVNSRNFVGKIKNTVRNVSKYIKSSGNPIFVWEIPEIELQTSADAKPGADQHATNGSNAANEEMDLFTTLHITQKQFDKLPQCTVCLDEYEIDVEAMKLTCGHIFHEKCITHWIIMHGTCPVCRRYFCPSELHLPRERVSVFQSIVRRLHRTLRSPLFYFFPSLELSQAMNDRRRATPMYRLIRVKRVTSPLEPADVLSTGYLGHY